MPTHPNSSRLPRDVFAGPDGFGASKQRRLRRLASVLAICGLSSCANLDVATFSREPSSESIPACRPVSEANPNTQLASAEDISDNETSEPQTVIAPSPETIQTVGSAGLTLDVLEAMALENNPTLRQAGLLVQQAEGNWQQVGLYPNPVAGYMGEEINDEGTLGKQGVFVNQTIVTADKLELNQAAASWNVEQNRWQANAQRWAVVNSVRDQFYQLLAAQRTVEVAEELHAIVQKGLQTARELQQAGQVPQTDVLQAKLELNAVDVILQTARHQESGARRELAALIGVDELPAESLQGQLDRTTKPLKFEQEWIRLQAENPVLQSAHAQVEQARAQLRREQVQPIPDVQLQANVLNDFATDNAVFGLQLGVMLPVHDKNQGNISAAYAKFHAALENVQRLEYAIRQQLAQAVQRYEVARTQVDLYRDEILPTAQEALDLTTRGYQSGEIGFLRLLTVRRTYVENQINSIAAMRELNSASVQLQGLLITGGLSAPGQVVSNFGGSSNSMNQSGIGREIQPAITTPKVD